MTSQTQERTQGEVVGAFLDARLDAGGETSLPERVEAVEERRVFFRTGGGGEGRRRANRLLSSMIHSTVSPRWNSIAWATAAGKLMYHCSLDLR